MGYTVNSICDIVHGKFNQFHQPASIEQLLLDSRKVYFASVSLFFALKSSRRNGHLFIAELYEKGVRNFVMSEDIDLSPFAEGNFILVDDVLAALQMLAAYHRSRFNIPVIGITGSNGKTIVKEWLYQLLHNDYNIVRSPKSYNSQIGVPLSVWQMNERHNLAVFEAGISQPDEMIRLEKIIKPTVGILTNIGDAHNEGFKDVKQKLAEKLKLFKTVEILIAPGDDELINKTISESGINFFSWGKSESCSVQIISINKESLQTVIILNHKHQTLNLSIPFTDDASIENAISCACMLLWLKTDVRQIEKRMLQLSAVNMRLELKKGINNCMIINDSYSADLSSLSIALNFLQQQSAGGKKTVILSDFLQSGEADEELYNKIAALLHYYEVNRVISIGPHINEYLKSEIEKTDRLSYASADEFKYHFRSSQFKDETILIKGARVFEFEEIVRLLEQKVHQTVLEINLNAIAHNLKQYQQLLRPATKIMAMVKAFAYGSGGAEIAGTLQYHKIDYLGVAYADEGIELRKAGISLPVMVMNPEESTYEAIVEHSLEPEIYSFETLRSFDAFLKQEGLQQYPVHIEIETGMNRLGFAIGDVQQLAACLLSSSFKVQSVFSHLVGSEDQAQDEFTLQQFERLQQAADNLQKVLGYSFIYHLSNSAAILRHPQLQLDMVRLGIGLYGVSSAATNVPALQTVATLKSTVAQVKHLKAGESVSYNRKGVVSRNSVIATIRIGYADGYPRRLGNGRGSVFLKGKHAPVIGMVCMDMIMADVTDIKNVQEGDEVIIFGKELPVQQLAAWADTIPYEIMTGISQRVKRVYYEE